MVISYKKLWKLLIDRNMKKKDLIEMTGISPSTITRLGHDDSINTDVIVKICKGLNCDIGDIMEVLPEDA